MFWGITLSECVYHLYFASYSVLQKPIEIAFYLLTGSVFRMPFDRGSAVLGLMTIIIASNILKIHLKAGNLSDQFHGTNSLQWISANLLMSV
jgi:hypothetical protein